MSPHPVSDQRGHSYGHVEPSPQPLDEDSYRSNATYLYAIDLFNHGYYWEAHEAWEALWHAEGRGGPRADFLKGLIKLAAAGVKLKEGRPHGVARHAARAIELLTGARTAIGSAAIFGLEVDGLVASIGRALPAVESLIGNQQPAEARRLNIRLTLTMAGSRG